MCRVLVVALVVSACSPGVETVGEPATSTSSAPPTGSAPAEVTPPPRPPTTLPPEPVIPLIGWVSTFDHELVVVAGGSELEIPGDEEFPLRIAFDDLNGGLIYQYEVTPPELPRDAILHLLAGASQPEPLLWAPNEGTGIRLEDVTLLDGRLVMIYLETEGVVTTVNSAGVAGGAPQTLVTLEDGKLSPGGATPRRITALVGAAGGGETVALVLEAGNCRYVELRDSAGAEATQLGQCPTDVMRVALTDDGRYLAVGTDEAIEVHDLSTGSSVTATAVSGDIIGLDIEDGTVAIALETGLNLLAFDGRQDGVSSTGATALTFLRSVPEPGGTPFLGGVMAPAVCSAEGLDPASVPTGLTVEAAATWHEIVGEAADCDYEALGRVTRSADFTYSFGAPTGPVRYWKRAEQVRLRPLAEMVLVLGLPFTTFDLGDGTTVYLWPSAAGASPSDEDWEALASIYNEEEIDLYRYELQAYLGMRIGIAEDGTWLFAVEGD